MSQDPNLPKTSNPVADSDESLGGKPHPLLLEYKKYRFIIIGLAICCIALLVFAGVLYYIHVIDEDTQLTLILLSYAFVVPILILVFARVRPTKKKIRALNDTEDSTVDPQKKLTKKEFERQQEILASEKEKKHPDTPEYKRMRQLWRFIILAALAIMLFAMLFARQSLNDITIPLIILCSSYVLIFIAIYLEMKKLKPMRVEWLKQQKQEQKKKKYKK